MKKIITLSSLAFLISACSFFNNASLNLNDKKFYEGDTESSSTEGEVTYLPVDGDGNFSLVNSSKKNVTEVSSFIKNRTDTFWTTRSYSALDKFVDSINNNGEDWTGTFKSKSFTQNKKYIYFTLGGNSSNSVTLIDDSNNSTIETINNNYFSDPNASCNMLIYSIEVSDTNLGHLMHVEVNDTTTSGFGGVTFGDLHVNQTEEEVAKAYSIYLNNLNYNSSAAIAAENSKISRDYVYNLYTNSNNADLYKFYNYQLTDADVTFNQGNDNLSTLAFDSEYAEQLTTETTEFKFDSFISTETAYDWNEQMPFNNNGYFFNGNGYSTRNETAKFRFMTNKFILSGTGLVSIKMAGRSAQLQVLDPTKIGTADDPILYTLDVQDYADNGVSNVYLNGSNYNTMHRVYWDLSKYKGKEIVLAVADKDTNGSWGMIFWDDLITKYDTLPSLTVDTFSQTAKESNDTYYGAFTDLYVKASDTEGEYNTTFNEAYKFLNSYYAVSSKVDKKHNYFDSLNTSEAKAVVDAYGKLSTEAKAIVDSSKDFYFDGTGDDWQKNKPIVADVKDRVKAQVKITYVYNNGDENSEENADYKEIYTPKTPTRSSTWDKSYEFEGWYTDKDCSTKFLENQQLTSDITLYAKWNSKDTTEITNIKNSSTKAQLSYKYEATTSEDGTKSYSISDVAMRFGGFIKKADYDAIKEHITGYGVEMTANLPNGYSSLYEAIIGNATFGDGTLIQNENNVSEQEPYLATSDEKTNDIQSDDYYLFNTYMTVNNVAYYNKTVYAVSYIKIDTGAIVYLNERSASVASLAKEYLDNDAVTKTEDITATLTQLANYAK